MLKTVFYRILYPTRLILRFQSFVFYSNIRQIKKKSSVLLGKDTCFFHGNFCYTY